MLRYSSLLLPFLIFDLVQFNTASTAVERPPDFKRNCQLTASGCSCAVVEGTQESVREYSDVNMCKLLPEMQTAENKKKLNAEIEAKFGDFKENCFPKPSGGCKCNVDLGHGEEVKEFTEDKDCKKSTESVTAEHIKKLNEEIKEKFGNFKDNCFPKPTGGCKCNEKDAEGNDVVAVYNDVQHCETAVPTLGTSMNVRDPVREKAQANYAAVLDELHNKFKGLKEGCFPRPKGCLCVIGKTAEGRDITERRMKDVDCKCQEGERGHGCPAA